MMVGAQVAIQQKVGGQAPTNKWSTRLCQHSNPVISDDLCWGWLIAPCASARSKANVDGSNCCYNLLCWTPIGSYSYVRHEYGILGTCGDDIGNAFFAFPCASRQIYTEARLRGKSGAPDSRFYGANAEEWRSSLFGCSCCAFLQAVFCSFCVTNDVRKILQPSASDDTFFNCCCILPTSVYGQVRNHYGIVSDWGILEDLFLPVICFPCALIRARNEALAHALLPRVKNAMMEAAVTAAYS